MFKTFFGSRRYFFYAYISIIFSIILIRCSSIINIQIRQVNSTYLQLLSNCSTKKVECNTNKLIWFLFMSLLPRILVLSIISSISSYMLKRFIFVWRQAMTEDLLKSWDLIYYIEGTSQRIQEDTEKFARKVRALCTDIIISLNNASLIFPLLYDLRTLIPEITLFGYSNYAVFLPSIFCVFITTILIAMISYPIPSLDFERQKVEAAYRKELVLCEDNPERFNITKIEQLYDNIKKNRFKLFIWELPFKYITMCCRLITMNISKLFIWPSFYSNRLTIKTYLDVSNYMILSGRICQVISRRWRFSLLLISVYKRLNTLYVEIGKFKELYNESYLL
ncbi:hypothetical protein ACR3K2_29660 [Cryptosporidium serpentis]